MLKTCGILLLVCAALGAAPAERSVRSAVLAKQLGAALLEHRLEAIAARDPEAADRFVADLPDGLETVLGDRGVRLSGGERQRLALARALLREPSLLILDEATSSLDSENERRILDAIERLRGRTTILLITHRIAAVRGADVIHVVESGRLVESGSWAELLAAERGRFHALGQAQGIEPERETADASA